MTASDLMTPNPVTVTSQASLAEAWELMRELDVRHLPVVDGDELVGMLSDRDVGSLEVARLLTEEGAGALQRRLTQPVVQVMSADVLVADPDTELSDLIALLVEHRIGAIPVVRPDTRQLVGIVSYIDVLRAFQAELETE